MAYLTTFDIINWINKWSEKNPSPKDLTEADISAFAKGLNEQMLKLDYRVANGGTVIGYYQIFVMKIRRAQR